MPREGPVEIGTIVRAHGLRGEVVVRPAAAGADSLLRVSRVSLDSGGQRRAVEIRRARLQGKGVALTLAGVEDRTAAEALAGARLFVDAAELPPPEEGEYYEEELIGLAVVAPDGRPLGKVTELESAGAQTWFVVETPTGSSLVPFTEPLVRVDLPGRRLVVDAPEGLLEGEPLQ